MTEENNDALVPIVEPPEGMAKLNITWNGQNGDLEDPISYDATDSDILAWATEAISQGIPGVDADPQVNLSDFVIDRFPAREDIPVGRVVVRPKTPFGI